MLDEQQFNLAKSELELVQKQVDKYDDISAKIKTWSVTLWAALLGWSFQAKRKEILFLAIFVLILFWALDAVNKNFRMDYKKRRDKIAVALREFVITSKWPLDFVTPFFPEHQTRGIFKNFVRPHIFISYLALIVVALVIYFI